jgi:hypothetical protein
MKRMLLVLLCLGVLGTMTGCYVAPYPTYAGYAYPAYGGYAGTDVSISVGRGWRGHHHHYGDYRGYRYGGYSGWHRGGYSFTGRGAGMVRVVLFPPSWEQEGGRFQGPAPETRRQSSQSKYYG